MFSAIGQVATIAQGSTETVEFSAQLLYVLIQSFPGLITIVGIIAATRAAGPFGFAGVMMETVAVNSIFNPNTDPNIQLLFVGGGLIVIGTPFPWGEFTREILF